MVSDLQGQANNATLTLKEKNGSRRISMAVGLTEALAIAQKRGQAQIPPDQQPQAYILMRDTIQQLGGRIASRGCIEWRGKADKDQSFTRLLF